MNYPRTLLFLVIFLGFCGCVGDLNRCLDRNHWELAEEVDEWKVYQEGEEIILTSVSGSQIRLQCIESDQDTEKYDYSPCRSDRNEFIRMRLRLPDQDIEFTYEYSYSNHILFIYEEIELELNSKRGGFVIVDVGVIGAREDYNLAGEFYDELITIELYNEEVLNSLYSTEKKGIVGIEIQGELFTHR